MWKHLFVLAVFSSEMLTTCFHDAYLYSHAHQRKERQCHPSNDDITNHKVAGYVSFINYCTPLSSLKNVVVARIGMTILLTITIITMMLMKTNNNTNYIGKVPKNHHCHVYHVVNVPAGCYHAPHSVMVSMKLVPAHHPSFWDSTSIIWYHHIYHGHSVPVTYCID